MTHQDEPVRPLVDQSVLDRLRAELHGENGYCTVLVRKFIADLPHSMTRLCLALTTGDLGGTINTVLSLKSSSQMVGAERLATIAQNLEQSIREDSYHAKPELILPRLAAAHLRPISRCSESTLNLLQAHLQQGPGRY